jgi:hypothetical protein
MGLPQHLGSQATLLFESLLAAARTVRLTDDIRSRRAKAEASLEPPLGPLITRSEHVLILI